MHASTCLGDVGPRIGEAERLAGANMALGGDVDATLATVRCTGENALCAADEAVGISNGVRGVTASTPAVTRGDITTPALFKELGSPKAMEQMLVAPRGVLGARLDLGTGILSELFSAEVLQICCGNIACLDVTGLGDRYVHDADTAAVFLESAR